MFFCTLLYLTRTANFIFPFSPEFLKMCQVLYVITIRNLLKVRNCTITASFLYFSYTPFLIHVVDLVWSYPRIRMFLNTALTFVFNSQYSQIKLPIF